MANPIDLRSDFDAAAAVKDGALYRKGATVQVWWQQGGEPVAETWTLPDTAWGREQARENFAAMRERWS